MAGLVLGVDIAKQSFEATLGVAGTLERLGRFENSPTGFAALATALAPYQTKPPQAGLHLIVEPTGGDEAALVAFGYEQQWQVSLPNPKQVRDWAKGVGIRAKTDQLDSQLLTRYGLERQPQAQGQLPAEVLTLDLLLARRADLEQMIRAEGNRLQSLLVQPSVPQAVQRSLESAIHHLQTTLAELEGAIDAHVAAHPALQAAAERLLSQPGIGPKSVLPLLVLLSRWDALTQREGDAKGLTAFVGLDPKPYSSGSSVFRRPHISRQGNPTIRRLLYRCALGAIRAHNPFRDFYDRLVGRGKAKKLALIAVARKLLVCALALFRAKTTFDPEHSKTPPPAPQAA